MKISSISCITGYAFQRALWQAPYSPVRFYAIQQVQQTAKYQPFHYKAPYSGVTALLVIKIVTSIRECVVSDKPKSCKLKMSIIQVYSSK
jgi:hypothetical protein